VRNALRKLRRINRRRTTILDNAHVGRNFTFGNNSVLWAPRSLILGNDVSIGSDVRIQVDGLIGDSVLIASSVGIVGRSDHRMREVGTPIRRAEWVGGNPELLSKPVTIGSDVWIGYGATLLSGITVGDSSVIGAASVVTRDVPANSIVVGNPGRVVGTRFSPAEFNDHWAILSAAGVRKVSAIDLSQL
jgi:acetyltransferase-like isoleucine patch superfamily enzyme